jgi:MFS family permease
MSSGSTPTYARKQWLVLTLIFLAGIVNFMDRSSLAIANSSIRSELHLSGTQIGILLAAFTLAYGLAQLPIGPVLDRFGGMRVLGAGLGVWSVAQLLTGTVTGMASFTPLRVLLGIGEAPFFPASIKLVRERFAREQRGRATAAVNMSSIMGQAIAPPLLTLIMLRFGWRSMFVSLGCLGVVLALVWFRLQPRARPADYLDREISTTQPVDLRHWAALFRSRTIWGLMLGFGGINYSVWFYMGWLPAYLEHDRAQSLSASGWLAAIPFVAGGLGMFLSGVLADRAGRRGAFMPRVHRRQIVFGMLASGVATLVAAHAATTDGAITWIGAALFFIHFAGTSGWGYAQTASPRNLVGTVCSIQNCGGLIVASIAPALTGWLLDRTKSFATAFVLCGCVALLGAASYLLLVSAREGAIAAPDHAAAGRTT